MKLIDTHAHYYSSEFIEDLSSGIIRMKSNGIDKVLLPNIDCDSIHPMFDLCKNHPELFFPMLGLHPGYVDGNWESKLNQIYSEISNHKNIIAIGEIGMDLYWDKTFVEEQKKAFSIQIDWAIDLELPIVIHARESFIEIFDILDKKNCESLSGVFHCFTGTETEAERIQSYGGFYFGIGGVVTYKNSHLPEVIKSIPIDQILLETDAPYLPPVPYRGKRNEPSYIIHIAEKLAGIYEIDLDQIAKQTTQNALTLFKKLN
jgi:TatD DNase family protein